MKYWPTAYQWRTWSLPSKLTAIGTLAGMIALTIPFAEKIIDSLQRGHIEIRYLESKLGETTVTLLSTPVEPPTSRVQRHMLVDPNIASTFDLYGIWIINNGASKIETNNLSLFLNTEFNVTQLPGVLSCWKPIPSREFGYVSEFRCDVGAFSIGPGQRWDIPWFNGTPLPPHAMRVKLRIDYGSIADAMFTVRLPTDS